MLKVIRLEKQLKQRIDLKVSEFKDQLNEVMQINATELSLGISMIKRFLYRLTQEDAKHLRTILTIIGETDNEDLQDIIQEAIQNYTTPEQRPFVNAIMENDKIRDLLQSGKLRLLTEKFAELLKQVYG